MTVSPRRVLRSAAEGIRASPGGFILLAALGFAPGVAVANANQELAVPAPMAAALLLVASGGPLLVAHAAIAYGIAARLRGKACSPMEMLSATVLRAPSLAGVFALCSVLGMLALVLLIAPAILMVVALLPLAAVTVTESLGPLAAIRRTAQLTKGRRIPIFLSLCGAGCVALASCCGLGGCTAAMALVSAPGASSPIISVVLNFAHSSLVILVVSATSGAVYHELRRLDDQAPPPRVF